MACDMGKDESSVCWGQLQVEGWRQYMRRDTNKKQSFRWTGYAMIFSQRLWGRGEKHLLKEVNVWFISKFFEAVLEKSF